jgi:hypothetical protein
LPGQRKGEKKMKILATYGYGGHAGLCSILEHEGRYYIKITSGHGTSRPEYREVHSKSPEIKHLRRAVEDALRKMANISELVEIARSLGVSPNLKQ